MYLVTWLFSGRANTTTAVARGDYRRLWSNIMMMPSRVNLLWNEYSVTVFMTVNYRGCPDKFNCADICRLLLLLFWLAEHGRVVVNYFNVIIE